MKFKHTLIFVLALLFTSLASVWLWPMPHVDAALGDKFTIQTPVSGTMTDVIRIRSGGALCITSTGSCSKTDTAGTIELAATREIQIPLRAFVDCSTTTPADLSFVAHRNTGGSDALPDFEGAATAAHGFTISFDEVSGTVDDDSAICAQFAVPADYVSGGSIVIRTRRDTAEAATGTAEVITGNFIVNGATAGTEATNTITTLGSASLTLTPTATLAANDSVFLSIDMETLDQGVSVETVKVTYVANQ